ncbi:MAG: FAD/NAD(P)-binding protein [Pseudomonadota bacterium]
MDAVHHRTHALVGDGITALAFLQGLTLDPGDELIVLGRSASQLGRGIAYAAGTPGTPWQYAYLLNSPADDIDPAFARWLADNWHEVEHKMAGRQPDWLGAARTLVGQGDLYGLNAPREFYGDFMVEEMQAALAKLRQRGVHVRVLDTLATAIESSESAIVIETEDGRSLAVHSASVAPGGPSTQRIPGDDGPFAAPTLFGHEARIAEHIRAGAEIFCIGANATMLDVLRLCQSLIDEDALRFVACSPRGELPPPLVPRLPRRLTVPKLTQGHESARSFLDNVWQEIEAARERGEEMREIRAGFRAHFLAHPLSSYVTSLDEARKVPGTLRHWLRGGTRDTILDFHRLMKLAKTRTHSGAVVEIEHLADGARVVLHDRAGNTQEYRADFVVNCSGPGAGSSYDPLTEQMLAKGWIGKCAVTGGLEVGAGCATREPRVRHLSPGTTVIGQEVMAMPLYDAHMLRNFAGLAQASAVF